MSNTTQHVPLLFHKENVLTLQTRLIDSLCIILFILGIIGNLLGLFIFSSSRRSSRISSSYANLATCSSITNLLCLIRYTSILHSKSRDILSEVIGKIWWACKIYEFSFSFRLISSWIILFWMFERLVCVSTRLRTFFHRWNLFKFKLIFPILIMIIILVGVIGPPVYMFQPRSIEYVLNITPTKFNLFIIYFRKETMNITKKYCGISPNTSVEWKKYFRDIYFGRNHFTIRCIFSELIPTGAIILFNSYIVHHLTRTCQHLHRTNSCQLRKQRSRTTSWMNIVIILHSSLFLLSLFSHITGHFMGIEAHETWWASLAIVVNCSLNFYIYCLSGKAFRNEIRRFIQRCKIQRSFTNNKFSTNRRQNYYYNNKNSSLICQ